MPILQAEIERRSKNLAKLIAERDALSAQIAKIEALVSPKPRSLKRQHERHLAQMGMGILIALKESKMSVGQAEEDLFNLEVYQAAKRLRLDPVLIEFLQWGMELGDVEALAPEAMAQSFKAMHKLLLSVLGKTSGQFRQPNGKRRPSFRANARAS